MNRMWANAIRFLMDECLPPLVRDNRLLMYPLYRLAYRGADVRQVMNFKSIVQTFTPQDYVAFYRSLDSFSRRRDTDLSPACVRRIVDCLQPSDHSFLDVGCGSGYLLRAAQAQRPDLRVVGCDVSSPKNTSGIEFVYSQVGRLPFADQAFDTVSCCHTLEHVLDLAGAWQELERVARHQLLVVVPRQRYYYYTLDEHVHFFPDQASLVRALGLARRRFELESIWGDWLLRVEPERGRQ